MKYDFSQYRADDVEYKLQIARFRPFDIMVTGVTGAGKSTTLNAFFQRNIAKVGEGVAPETMTLDSYALNGWLRFWDTPGLGDGIERDKIHQQKIKDLLQARYLMEGQYYGFIDMVLVVIDATSRDLGTTYRLLNEVILPNFQTERVLVIINQADFAMKGRHWLSNECVPDSHLLEYLNELADSVKKRIWEATGWYIRRPVFYSAEYGFGVQNVMDFLIDQMPCRRRPISF